MKTIFVGALGFVAGWGARAVFDSGRDVIVALTAAAYGAVETGRRTLGMEREYFEDLIAEGKAKWEASRHRRAQGGAGCSREGAKP